MAEALCAGPGNGRSGMPVRCGGRTPVGEPIVNPTVEHHQVSNLPHANVPAALMEPRAPAPAPDIHEIDIKAWFKILVQSRWLIGALALIATLFALAYALSSKPVYQADMVLHIEEESPNASNHVLIEASSLFETKKAAIAEIELLRSRMVISNVVEKMGLHIDVQPKYFPIIGSWLAGRAGERLSEPGILGYGGYVWGGEKVAVSRFEVPASWENRILVITARGGGRYGLGDGSALDVDGKVGETVTARTDAGNIELRIDSLDAKAGAQILLKRVSRLDAIRKIQDALTISEQGKQSGIIEVQLQGDDAQWVSNVLGAIGREYIGQDAVRKGEEARRSMLVLSARLLELRKQLERSESAYQQFQEGRGVLQSEQEGTISLGQAAEAKTRRIDLMQKKSELVTRYGPAHPAVIGISKQLEEADLDIMAAARHIKTIPLVQQEEVRLKRDIAVNTEMYTVLSNTAQQLGIISVGKASSVRLIDIPMVPDRPIKPKRPLIVALGLVTGLFLGIVAAFFKQSVYGRNEIDDPAKIESMLGPRVLYATIPHSDIQMELERQGPKKSHQTALLASVAPDDAAIEGLRTFRAALQFSMPQSKTNIIMFTGPTSGVGISFLSANCAAVMAAAEKKVLLIDADFRNGRLNCHFGIARASGLYEYVTGQVRAEKIIHRAVMRNLDFIPTGRMPKNAGEFLHHLDFCALLESVNGRYDFVLVDLPPLLEVADALTSGGQADAIFLLARAGLTTEEEISSALKRMNLAGISPQGIVFNDSKVRAGSHGYPRRLKGFGRS